MGVDLAATLQDTAAASRASRLRFVRLGLIEFGVVAIAYLAYSLSCGSVHAHREPAFANAARIISLEGAWHLLVERQMQLPVLSHGWLVQTFNAIYMWGHLPLILTVGVWLFLCHQRRYRVVRNAVLISGGLALVGFYALPVAPPRLIPSLHIVDTAAMISPVYDTVEPKVFFNPYAAIPSMHIAWDLLMGIALTWSARSIPVRWLGALLPLGMLIAVIVTGNHYVVDGLLGALVGLLGLAIALAFERTRLGHGITGAAAVSRDT